jgi:hypothetical protein
MKKQKKKITHSIVALRNQLPELFAPKRKNTVTTDDIRTELLLQGFERSKKIKKNEAWYKVTDENKKDLAVVFLFTEFGAFCRTGFAKKDSKRHANFYDGGGPFTLQELMLQLKAERVRVKTSTRAKKLF